MSDAHTDRRLVFLVLAAGADPVAARTPLSDAATPTLDRIARDGHVGRVDLGACSVYEGFLGLLGQPPGTCSAATCCARTAAIDVPTAAWVARADLVTVDRTHLLDSTGGGTTDAETDALLAGVAAADPSVTFHRIGGGRTLVVTSEDPCALPAPAGVTGRRLDSVLPVGGPARALFDRSVSLFQAHDVNAVRLDLGENPANALWVHAAGPGRTSLDSPPWARGRTVLIGAGPAAAGAAALLGWQHRDSDGTAEDLCASAFDALGDHEVIVVRATEAQTAGLMGDTTRRIAAIAHLDARLAAPLLGALEERGEFVLAVAADSVFDTVDRVFTAEPAPFGVLRSGPTGHGQAPVFSEQTCLSGGHRVNGTVAFAAMLAKA